LNGGQRVLRGGSWNNNPDNARSANRNRNNAGNRNNSIGLRLASTLVKPEPVWSRSRRVCKRVSRVCHDENGRENAARAGARFGSGMWDGERRRVVDCRVLMYYA
jgi:Sulfatase-modifying factor enzyme 1